MTAETTFGCQYLCCLLIFLTLCFSSYAQVRDIADTTGTAHIDFLNEQSYTLRKSKPYTSLQHAREALRLSKNLAYVKGEGSAHVMIGLYYWSRSVHEKSLEHAQTAQQLFAALNDKKGLMDTYTLFGLTYIGLKQKEKAEEYFRQSLALALQLDHADGIARSYNALGNIARSNMDFKQAMAYYVNANDALANDEGNSLKTLILINMGRIYTARGDIEQSKTYLAEALVLALKQSDSSGMAATYLSLGDLAMVRKDLVLAEQYFKQCELLSKRLGEKTSLLNLYIALIELKTMTGKPAEAHAYQQRYRQVRDSIFNVERAEQITELETRYDTEKKEHTIELLKQKSKVETIWRYVLLVGVLLTAFAGIIIYRLQRIRIDRTKQMLDMQENLNIKLQELDKMKTNFFANVSHEFRTPLTLILAPLEEELAKRPASEHGWLKYMKRNATRLHELVDQLLDLSKLEVGKMQLRVKKDRLDEFLNLLLAPFDSWAESKKINFIRKLDLSTDAVWFDKDKVEKISTNLLSNAFKFTPEGGTVTITVRKQMQDGISELCITVSDTGPGIQEDEQDHVFSAFYQTHQGSDNQVSGSGLGLSLVKELVTLYRGHISLKSEPFSGTLFHVSLPVAETAFLPEQRIVDDFVHTLQSDLQSEANEADDFIEPESSNISNDSILIVEDNADLRKFMSGILTPYFTVITARNGEEGLTVAAAAMPNLVLTDLMMPGMGGMQLLEKLKNDERTSHIPVIMLTARNEQHARIEGLKGGADDYLTKPFSSEELRVRITNLIDQRKQLAERFRERILISVTPTQESSLDDRFLLRVSQTIEAHMSDVTFSVERLAEYVGLDRSQLLRKLKALTGFSPNELIKDLRLKRAADMIRHKADTITQVGYAVGFNDPSYFTKCFKKAYGLTPTEFALEN